LDGSVISGDLSVSEISVETDFGKLVVPIDRLRSFTPGLDSNTRLSQQIDTLIKNLGSDDYQTREQAHKDLAAMGRGVARAAGVSPSLVQHHFGTKEGLQEACDAYVAQQLRQGVEHGVTEQALADPAFVAETHRTAPVILRYLARALTDGWPAATDLFEQAVTLTEAHLTAQDVAAGQATRTRAAVFTAMKLGVVVLHDQLSRVLAIDTLSPNGMSRVSDAVLDIVSPTLIGEDLANAARRRNNAGD
jgi:AcrR family transcriptional regulator